MHYYFFSKLLNHYGTSEFFNGSFSKGRWKNMNLDLHEHEPRAKVLITLTPGFRCLRMFSLPSTGMITRNPQGI